MIISDLETKFTARNKNTLDVLVEKKLKRQDETRKSAARRAYEIAPKRIDYAKSHEEKLKLYNQ